MLLNIKDFDDKSFQKEFFKIFILCLDKKESRTPNIYPYNKFQPVKPKQEPGIRKSLEQVFKILYTVYKTS